METANGATDASEDAVVEVGPGREVDGTVVRTELTDADRRRLFEEQVMPEVDRLYAGAMRYTRNPTDAEDLVQ